MPTQPDEHRNLTAYLPDDVDGLPIEPAPKDRDWLRQQRGLAYGCLPLLIANQSGWLIGCPYGFTAMWNGGERTDDLQLRFDDDLPSDPLAIGTSTISFDGASWSGESPEPSPAPELRRVQSTFGNGVISFVVPYIFRTPPGVNLWVKGPSNHIKDAIQPLEGVVETDWCPATFTMNWKFTSADRMIRFEAGEPFCMIVPIPRGFVESFEPGFARLSSDPELQESHFDWKQGRMQSIAGDPDLPRWEKDYFKGRLPDGTPIDEHQMELNVRPFPSE